MSAMTVPTLMQNYQKKSYVTQLHKVYNEMSQAAIQFQTDRNAVNLREAGLNSQTAAEEFIEKYFKIVQKCGTDKTPCFEETSNYKKLSGNQLTGWTTPMTHYVIASGASIGVRYNSSNEMICEIYVDVNGKKGPNIVGRDLFPIFLYNNGLIDDDNEQLNLNGPLSKEERDASFNNICQNNNGNMWHGCFGKILNDNWEMTY